MLACNEEDVVDAGRAFLMRRKIPSRQKLFTSILSGMRISYFMYISNRKEGRIIPLLTGGVQCTFRNLSQRWIIFPVPESARPLLPLKNTSGARYAYAMVERERLSFQRGKGGGHYTWGTSGRKRIRDTYIYFEIKRSSWGLDAGWWTQVNASGASLLLTEPNSMTLGVFFWLFYWLLYL